VRRAVSVRLSPLCLLLALALFLCASAAAQSARVRISQLSGYLGQTVTVKGRTGQILEQFATGNTRAFSLRDDYGDMVVVLTTEDYPIMGVTLHVTGIPEKRNSRLFLRASALDRWPQVSATDLPNRVGDLVRIRGTVTGATKGEKGFLLTDEKRAQVRVSYSESPKPGSVVIVFGKVEPTPEGGVRLAAESVQVLSTPASGVSLWLILSVAGGAAVLILGGVTIILRRRAAVEALPAPWGWAEVVSGDDQGKRFALRYDEVDVGREADPLTGVCIASDTSVSRQHGKIIRDSNGQVVYEDTGSRCGSWINEVEVPRGQRVPLPQGALLRLGPNTTIRVAPVGIDGAPGSRETTIAGDERTGPPQGDVRPTT